MPLFSMQLMFMVLAACVLQSYSAEWRWEGKVAVVTGASSGIGAETAVALADKGMVVIGLARREEKIKELSSRTKGKIHALKCDLTIEDEIIKVFRYIETTFGGVDVLVNNAGVYRFSSLIDGETSDWKAVMDVNVMALSVCTKEALKSMRKRGDNGHIININSAAGHQVPNLNGLPIGLYAASKYAVTAVTESLRLELRQSGSKIKTTSISPGAVVTEMVSNLTIPAIELAKKNNLQLPLPVFINPEDVADAILYALETRPIVQIHEISIEALGHSVCGK